MTASLKDEILKDFENRVNKRINTLYDTFYIKEYDTGQTFPFYGVVFNGKQIALCNDINALEQVINTIIFFLEGGITTK